MPSCAFTRCTNSSKTKNKVHDITFHTFPQDELWRHKWLQVVRKQRQEPDWLPTKNSRLCSIHFKPEDMYKTSKGYRKISISAVPYFQAGMEAANYSVSGLASPSSLNSVNISDLESIFESPIKASLKRKLNKETLKRQKLMKENKNLKKKYKRLINKCKKLKETITQLKKKINVICKSRMLDMKVDGCKSRVRPKKILMDCVKDDTGKKGVQSTEMT